MLSRSAVSRQAQQALRQPRCLSSRSYAAAASSSFQYQTGDASGIKLASRDIPGPVATLAVVAKAGTRYQTYPGLAEALQLYAFKNTKNRSTLRIQRESELLGAELVSHHSRENLVVGAKFLRDDLPYFAELLAEVTRWTAFEDHVVHEEIHPLLEFSLKKHLANPLALAQDSVHRVAFHRGLGEALHPTSATPFKKYVNRDSIMEYSRSAYAKPSFAIVANGVEHSELSKWVNEFFQETLSTPAHELKSEQAKYYGGEERIAHASGNSVILAFPGSSSATGATYKPEVAVLAALLGGESSIKWAPGFSLLSKATQETPLLHVATKSAIYTDAGLLTVSLSGSASDIRQAAPKVVEVLKAVAQNVSNEDFQKAKALAKFKELEFGSGIQSGMELTGAGLVRDGNPYQIDQVAKAVDAVTLDKVKTVAKEALEYKASVSSVGDLFVLPFAEEIGLKV